VDVKRRAARVKNRQIPVDSGNTQDYGQITVLLQINEQHGNPAVLLFYRKIIFWKNKPDAVFMYLT